MLFARKLTFLHGSRTKNGDSTVSAPLIVKARFPSGFLSYLHELLVVFNLF